MYFKIEKESNERYIIRMTDLFYKYCYPFYKRHSYFNILYRMYGLLPYDFYHYMSAKYNMHFEKGTCAIISFFKTEKDAMNYCRDLNTRFDYCVKNKFFEN